MKKTFRVLGLAIVAIMLSFSLTACGDDDDDDHFQSSDFKGQDSALVGSWTKTETGTNWSDTETIVFNSDGTYEETDVEVNGQNTRTSWEKGTWKTNNAKTQILFQINDSSDRSDIGEQDVENYSVSSGILTLDRDVYLADTAN